MAAAGTMPIESTAADLKQQGNEHYSLRQFPQALEFYSAAIQLSPLAPVLFGNRSAVYFEMGRYPAAISDILEALRLMSPADRTPSSPLYAKLVKRLLLAQMHSLHPDDWRFDDSLVQLTEADQQLVAAMKEWHAPGADDAPGPSAGGDAIATRLLQRCILHDRDACEYFPVGHDHAVSLLAGSNATPGGDDAGPEQGPARIPLHALRGPSPFSVLMGGVGDARHVLATLADLYDQQHAAAAPAAESSSTHATAPAAPPSPKTIKLHFLLNDLNATAIARLILLFLDIQRLAEFPDVHDRSDPDLVRRLYAATTSYVGIAVHRDVHDDLLDSMRHCIDSEAWFLHQLPFLSLRGAATGAAVRRVFALWSERASALRLEDVLRRYDCGEPDKSVVDGVLAPGVKAHMAEKMDENAKKTSEGIREFIHGLSDDQVNALVNRCCGDNDDHKSFLKNEPAARQRNFLLNMMADESVVANVCAQSGKRDLLADDAFLSQTKLMLPPAELPGLPPDVAEHIRGMRGAPADLGAPPFPPPLASHLLAASRPNPVMFDFDYHDAVRGELRHGFNAVEAATAIGECTALRRPAHSRDVYDLLGAVLWKAGRALAECDVRLELDVGDVVALAQELADDGGGGAARARAAAGLPTRFHRIMASNIPDYCGLLPALLAFTPLLAQPTGGAGAGAGVDALLPSYILINVLANTGIWANYREYVFSSTMLAGEQEAAQLLGLRLCGKGDVWEDVGYLWEDHQVWTAAPAAVPDPAVALPWLQRLLLGIGFPARRTTAAMCCEVSPMSMNALLLALQRMAERGVPAHGLAALLTDVLAGGGPCAALAAAPPAASPNPVAGLCRRTSEQPVAALRAELAALAALWSRRRPPGGRGGFVALPPALLPRDVTTFVAKLPALPWIEIPGVAHGYSPALCLLLGPVSLHPLQEDGKALMHSPESNFYREELLCPRRCLHMHVFSALQRVASRTYTFVASAAFVDALIQSRSHFAVLLRVDDWSALSPRVSLESAVQRLQP